MGRDCVDDAAQSISDDAELGEKYGIFRSGSKKLNLCVHTGLCQVDELHSGMESHLDLELMDVFKQTRTLSVLVT